MDAWLAFCAVDSVAAWGREMCLILQAVDYFIFISPSQNYLAGTNSSWVTVDV